MAVSTPGSPDYGKFWSNEDLVALVAPPASVRQTVLSWLASSGVVESEVTDNGDAVGITTSLTKLESLFATTFKAFYSEEYGRVVFAAMGKWSLPEGVADYVDHVMAISQFPVQKPRRSGLISRIGSPNIPEGLFPQNGVITPGVIRRIYNMSGIPTAKNPKASVAAVEFQGTNCFSYDDLEKYAQNTGLPFTNASVINKASFSPTGCDGESALDMQLLEGVAVGSQLQYWGNEGWIYEWQQQYLTMDNPPQVTSLSYGWMEAQQCQIAQEEW